MVAASIYSAEKIRGQTFFICRKIILLENGVSVKNFVHNLLLKVLGYFFGRSIPAPFLCTTNIHPQDESESGIVGRVVFLKVKNCIASGAVLCK